MSVIAFAAWVSEDAIYKFSLRTNASGTVNNSLYMFTKHLKINESIMLSEWNELKIQ